MKGMHTYAMHSYIVNTATLSVIVAKFNVLLKHIFLSKAFVEIKLMNFEPLKVNFRMKIPFNISHFPHKIGLTLYFVLYIANDLILISRSF